MEIGMYFWIIVYSYYKKYKIMLLWDYTHICRLDLK